MKSLLILTTLMLTACTPQVGGTGGNGHNAVVSTAPTAASCSNGGVTLLTAVDTNDNGRLDIGSDSNIMSQEICNGLDGQDGKDGLGVASSPYMTTELINPCGDASGVNDEVLLRLYNGIILASLSDKFNGNNTRLSVLSPGTYSTTDDDHCTFTITSDGQITNEHHHREEDDE
jgi:hypothetical protein